MASRYDNIFKWICTIGVVVILLFFVIPAIFGTAIRILFELLVLAFWGFVGYVLIKALESVWKKK